MIPRTGITVSKKELFGLLIVFIVYVLLGGLVFMLLESPLEEKLRRDLDELRSEFHEKLGRLGTPNVTREEMESLMLRLANAHSQSLIDEEGNDTHTNWSFSNSFFFAITVVTTIGYGHLSPSTTPGRLFCILYAVVGIPLTGILLAAIGGHYSQRLVRGLQKVRRGKHSKIILVLSAAKCLVPWLFVFLIIPAGFFMWLEEWSFVESFYYCFITLSTIGFGDYVAGNFAGNYIGVYKIIVVLWIIFGLGYLAMILNYISRMMRCKQIRRIERKLSTSVHHTQQKMGQRLDEVYHILQDVSRDIITEKNPLETEDGEPLVEGDIILPHLPRNMENDVDDELEERKGLLNIISLWPSGRITYNFHSSVSKETRAGIRDAMDEWEKETCLTFHEAFLDLSYLRFRTDRSGCWSMVGRQNNLLRGQDISIGPGCERKSVIVHEIGHAIGLYHEQSRSDRNGYINILWHNIPTGLQSQFTTGLDYARGVEYDYTSVMHYSSMAFSKKPFEKNTIVTKNPHYQRLIGSGKRISFRDAKLVNRMYSCNVLCPNLINETQQCQNDGYHSPYRGDGKNCHCICPPGSYGTFCEKTRNTDYYSPPICGGNVTEEQEIETPGYPKRELPNDSCSWWIQAPEGKRVMVTFLDFSFYPRLASRTSKYRGRCLQERVEIRTHNMAEGYKYCGEDIKPGTNISSKQREFIIIITTTDGYQNTRGLTAKVSFID